MATIIAIVAIVVVVAGLKLGESAATTTAKSGKVPDVIGMMQDKANTLVVSQGFKFTIAGTEKNDKPKGTVISCYPNVGDTINKGDAVRVTISSGPDQSVVPDVRGLDLERAKEVIQNAGYTVGDVSKDYSDSPANTVTSINPTAGTTLDKGSAISMVISIGPRIKQSVVPSLRGKSQDEAVAALRNINLAANVRYTDTQDSNQNNIVADQDIPAGTKLNQGAKVTIAVYRYTPPAALNNSAGQNASNNASPSNNSSSNQVDNKTDTQNNSSSQNNGNGKNNTDNNTTTATNNGTNNSTNNSANTSNNSNKK